MRLVQFQDKNNNRQVGLVRDHETILPIPGMTAYELALRAIEKGQKLTTLVESLEKSTPISYQALVDTQSILPPIHHPDPAHLIMSGTGLTHLGSAQARDQMHEKLSQSHQLTDSMRMFKRGLESGKPQDGGESSQPEWFYKGNGTMLVSPYQDLVGPSFALDGGDEAEIAAIFINGPDGTPYWLGFCLANEFSDHVMEQQNYLLLAHSKLRACSIGPELLIGELPISIEGKLSIKRGEEILLEKHFLCGNENMTHTVDGLIHHHFKYPLFRQPGDVHVHFLGAAALSFSEGIRLKTGDKMTISSSVFGRPLINDVGENLSASFQTKKLY